MGGLRFHEFEVGFACGCREWRSIPLGPGTEMVLRRIRSEAGARLCAACAKRELERREQPSATQRGLWDDDDEREPWHAGVYPR